MDDGDPTLVGAVEHVRVTPQKPRFSDAVSMSAKCQKRTWGGYRNSTVEVTTELLLWRAKDAATELAPILRVIEASRGARVTV